MAVEFRLVRAAEADAIHRWHLDFQAKDDAIYPRTAEEFDALIYEGALWIALEGDEVLGLAYADHNLDQRVIEVGGLMVADAARGRGVGTTLMRLALGQALLENDPLREPRSRVVAHVLKSNQSPRRIIEDQLKFEWVDDVELPASEMRGLRADEDGYVRGDEFELTVPGSLQSMIEWAAGWNGYLPKGELANLELTHGMTPRDWASAFEDMLRS